MKATETINVIQSGGYDKTFFLIYGEENVLSQRQRYVSLIKYHVGKYGDEEIILISSPGRTEIIGNHVDHNGGKAIGAAINCDIAATASAGGGEMIRLSSLGYNHDNNVQISTIDKNANYFPLSSAMIAGVCEAFKKDNKNIGAFNSFTVSDVAAGSGLSSSAAFEMVLCTILNHYYNNGSIQKTSLAEYGKYSENVFLKKPSGLLDQLCCIYGGALFIDFGKTAYVEKTSFDINKHGYSMFLINTGSSHSDLTKSYADIKKEMHNVASQFKKDRLSDVDEQTFFDSIPRIRKACGDRAVLRAIHFFEEVKRTEKAFSYIKADDFISFLKTVADSGKSSAVYLQNLYPQYSIKHMPVVLALALAEKNGATARVHGGGFAGTVQAYVKANDKKYFKRKIECCFGKDSCKEISIRDAGACVLHETT